MFSSMIYHIKSVLSNSNNAKLERDHPKRRTFCNNMNFEDGELKNIIYDLVRTIRDPERPVNLESLNVVFEDGITVTRSKDHSFQFIRVEFTPTISHCSLATLIGLCIRIKLQRSFMERYKLDVYLKKGSHDTEEEVNKQINDKERVAAAMENKTLRDLVELCIKEEE